MTEDLLDYNMRDKNTHLKIDQIFPLSERAYSLLYRNRDKVELKEKAIVLFGAIDMIKSLEYHYNHFTALKDEHNNLFQNTLYPISILTIQEIEKRSEICEKLCYEAVAYINRIGQFHYFSKSNFVTLRIPKGVGTILIKTHDLLIFRMKNAAHRSIDHPHWENNYDRIYQAMSLSNMGNIIQWGRVIYQIQSDGKCIYFDIELDHSIILNEFYELFRQVVEN